MVVVGDRVGGFGVQDICRSRKHKLPFWKGVGRWEKNVNFPFFSSFEGGGFREKGSEKNGRGIKTFFCRKILFLRNMLGSLFFDTRTKRGGGMSESSSGGGYNNFRLGLQQHWLGWGGREKEMGVCVALLVGYSRKKVPKKFWCLSFFLSAGKEGSLLLGFPTGGRRERKRKESSLSPLPLTHFIPTKMCEGEKRKRRKGRVGGGSFFPPSFEIKGDFPSSSFFKDLKRRFRCMEGSGSLNNTNWVRGYP